MHSLLVWRTGSCGNLEDAAAAALGRDMRVRDDTSGIVGWITKTNKTSAAFFSLFFV